MLRVRGGLSLPTSCARKGRFADDIERVSRQSLSSSSICFTRGAPVKQQKWGAVAGPPAPALDAEGLVRLAGKTSRTLRSYICPSTYPLYKIQ